MIELCRTSLVGLICLLVVICPGVSEAYGVPRDLEEELLLHHEVERRADASCNSLDFEPVAWSPVTSGHKDSTWFSFDGAKNCKWWCIEENFKWGTCKAYALEEDWWRAKCYVFDHQLPKDSKTSRGKGITYNRMC